MKIIKVFFKYIFAYFLLTLVLFSCKQESMEGIESLDAYGNRPLVRFQLMTAQSDYALTGSGISAATTGIALTEVTMTLSSCSVSSDNKEINLSSANSQIIWNNTCTFTFKSIGVNSETKKSEGTNTFNSSTIINTNTPFNAYFENGYMLQITSVGSLFGTTSFTAPTITLTLYTIATKSASISSLIIPIVGSGNQFSCSLVFPGGVYTAGKVYCWGKNGAMGIDSTIPKLKWSSAAGGSIVNLVVGNELACVQNTAGNVYCWGAIGAAGATVPNLTQIGTNTTYTTIAAGYKAACGVTSGGSLNCWGSNFFNGSNVAAGTTPVVYNGLSTPTAMPTALAVGLDFVCGIIGSNAEVKCLGMNSSGQLGNGSNENYLVPKVGTPTLPSVVNSAGTSLKNVKTITANLKTACATTSETSNNTYCWGQTNDVLIPGTTTPYYEPNIFGSVTTLTNLSSYMATLFNGSNGMGSGYFYNTQIPWLSYAHSGTPILPSIYGYSSSATLAQNFSSTLSNIGLGLGALCGGNGTSTFCFGVDLANGAALGTFGSVTSDTTNTYLAFNKYSYGSSGSASAQSFAYTNSYLDNTTYTYKQSCSDTVPWKNYYKKYTISQSCNWWSCSSPSVQANQNSACSWWQAGYVTCNNPVEAGNFELWESNKDCPSNGSNRASYVGDVNSWYLAGCPIISSKYECYTYNSPVLSNTALNSNGPASGAQIVSPTHGFNPSGFNEYKTVVNSTYTLSYNGIKYSASTSTAITTPAYIYQISVGSNYSTSPTTFGHVCAALIDGSIQCWGGNNVGQVGNNTTTLVTTPITILSPIGSNNCTKNVSIFVSGSIATYCGY